MSRPGHGLKTAMLKDFAISIIRTLRQHGFQAYLVGGCVRDLLLGREPADYDVATDATPDQVMRIFPVTYAVGAQFGVVLVPPDEELQIPRLRPSFTGRSSASADDKGSRDDKELGVQENATGAAASQGNAVEVATFRSDIGYSDGRHPDEVRFSKDPWKLGSSGLSASRSGALPRTSCACCGQFASRRDSVTRLSRAHSRRFRSWHHKFIRSPGSASATN